METAYIKLDTRQTPVVEIKLLNLMKIIVEAQWTIDEAVFADMLKLCGYEELIEEYQARREKELSDHIKYRDNETFDRKTSIFTRGGVGLK